MRLLVELQTNKFPIILQFKMFSNKRFRFHFHSIEIKLVRIIIARNFLKYGSGMLICISTSHYWRTRFGWGYGPVVRQTREQTIFNYISIFSAIFLEYNLVTYGSLSYFMAYFWCYKRAILFYLDRERKS